MKIGITGHQRLKDSAGWEAVQVQLDEALDRAGLPLIGLTSLAIGADQLFAESILARGGSIEAIIPFDGYELKFEEGAARQANQQLLRRASKVEVLQRGEQSEEKAYYGAGKRIVELCDRMIAVWDGRPAAGLGGTADVVAYSRLMQKPLAIISV
jgi:hypothetical protein